MAQWFKDPAVARVQPLAWELPYAECGGKKKKKRVSEEIVPVEIFGT